MHIVGICCIQSCFQYTNKYSGSWNDKTRMETSTKAKLDKSEGQMNSDKYRVTANLV